MRVLFTTPAQLGHVHPMVPLVRAVAARGHAVLCATTADGVAHVERAGLPVVATGPAGLPGLFDVIRRYPEIGALPPEERPNAAFAKLFGLVGAGAMLDDVVATAYGWKPDLVVADAAEFAGHIAASELGVPSVTKGYGALLPERRVAAAGEEVAPLWRSRRLEPRPYGASYDHLYLDVFPPGYHDEGDSGHVPRRQLLRPVAYDGETDGTVPPLLGRPEWPLVLVTMGTIFNEPALLGSVVAALADLDARLLVTVGPDGDPAALGPQPPNVLVERYVAQSAALPHCDVVVSHAGSGTMLASLAHGLPQLCLPQGADQFLNAAAVITAGAGLSLVPAEATGEAIRDAVHRLLDDPSYRHGAGSARATIEAMPSPDEVAAVLESLL